MPGDMVPGIVDEREVKGGREGGNHGGRSESRDGRADKEWPEMAFGSTGEDHTGIEEMVEPEVPLVRTKRKLVKAGEAKLAQEWEAAEATGSGKDGAD